MKVRVTILGCGGSAGVPTIGGSDGAGDWGLCDPDEPRNRRTRSSVLVEVDEKTRLLVDATPDLRQQLLAVRCDRIDGVLFTHAHADHCHGIDEMRTLKRLRGESVDVFAAGPTMADLEARFAFAFQGSAFYQPTARGHVFDGPFEALGVPVRPFAQTHGATISTGFRIGDLAYSTDVNELPEAAFDALSGVRVWIVDCLQHSPHPTHAHFGRVLEWVERIGPERTVLTHLNTLMDYHDLKRQCPPGVEPGYDGLILEL